MKIYMKTAMQQLIEELESIKANTEQSSNIIIQSFIDKAKDYIEVEREQIINTFDDSSDEYSKGLVGESICYGKDYYKEKFKQD